MDIALAGTGRDPRRWAGGGGGREGGLQAYLTLRCHHQNTCTLRWACSDESQLNVTLIVRSKVTRQHAQTKKEERGSATQPNPTQPNQGYSAVIVVFEFLFV